MKGILVNYEYCTGCHSCEVACKKILGLPKGEFGIKVAEVGPFQYSEREGVKGVWEWTYLPVLTKACDMCADRLARKELPVCVAACPQRALDFGTVEELRKRHGDDGMIAPLAAGDYTKPNLLITKCAQAQPAPERTRSWPDFLNDKTA